MKNIDIEEECKKEVLNLFDLQVLRDKATISMLFTGDYTEKKLFRILSDILDTIIKIKG